MGANEKNKTENSTIKPLSTLSVPCMQGSHAATFTTLQKNSRFVI